MTDNIITYTPEIGEHLKVLKPNGKPLRFKVADFEGKQGEQIILERTDKEESEVSNKICRIEIQKLRKGMAAGRVYVYSDPLETLYLEQGEKNE